MAIKHKRSMTLKVKPVAVEHTEFYPYLLRYNETMKVRNYAASTLQRRESDIRRFIGWSDERGITSPQDVTKPILERYQKHLYYYRQANGEPLTVSSRNYYISSIKQFFKWLTQENYLLYNPASELQTLKKASRLPVVLSLEEVEELMQQPKISTSNGLRDRAILEVLYCTGIRRNELCSLQEQDISLSRQTLYVREGKGGKDRLLPLGERATHWLERYQNEVRPYLLMDINQQALFLNDYGEKFIDNKLGDKVKRYMKKSGIEALGSCHLLRHAMATHMLENGADIRFIQAMLGHSSMDTTQIYTHVSIRKLQEIHGVTHPARLDVQEKEQDVLGMLRKEAEEE